MPDTISIEESFEHSLHNFLQWLEVVTMEPVQLCNAWGNYNVAWELVSDLNSDGNAIVTFPCSYLTEEQKQDVLGFLVRLSNIPDTLLVSATSISANVEAMSHPFWVSFRASASSLLQVLESSAAKNRKYFSSL
jgi:hypothetical protein